MGGDRAPGEIVAGAVAGRPTSSTCASCSSGATTSVAPVAARRTPAASSSSPPTEVVGDARPADRRCAPRRTRRSCAAPQLVQRRQGRRDGRARATPAPRWRPRCCAWAASGASPARRSRCRSRCPATSRRSSSTAAPPSTAPPSGCVQFAVMGREYARMRLGRRRTARRPAVERRGSRQGRRRCARTVYALLASEPGFVGNVEGRDFMHPGVDVIVTDGFTGNVALKTDRGRDPGHGAARVRRARSTPGGRGRGRGHRAAAARGGDSRSIPTTSAAACCSASTGCA